MTSRNRKHDRSNRRSLRDELLARRRVMQMEALEPRRLLAYDVTPITLLGDIVIQQDPGETSDLSIEVYDNGGVATFRFIDLTNDFQVNAISQGTTLEIPVADVTSITVNTVDDNDVIAFHSLAAAAVPITVDLGAGMDSLDASVITQPLTVIGGDGNDTITGGAGNDFIDGGLGNDIIDAGGGSDIVEGGPGDDTILGGAGDDFLGGDSGNDTIDGQAGNDEIRGDSTYDAAGVATSAAVHGNDILTGGDDNDTIYGEGGTDTITGDAGIDTIDGGDDNDTISGGTGGDIITGGGGDDTISGDDGDDNIQGDAGMDNITGDAGSDTIDGGDDNDTISGGTEGDIITGGGGDDTISGDDGDDNIQGDVGMDNITGDAGSDTIDGGDDNDTISGGTEGDIITGGGGDDTISGDDGDDNIQGDAGMDNITGDAGSDTIDGGDDNDTISGGTEGDIITGGGGDDTISGDDGDDNIQGDAGMDNITGDAGSDTIDGGDDNDTISGGTEGDIITGGGGDDTISGDDGDDNIQGDAGMDNITGGAGSDTIDGGDDNDTISGGTEGDIITGGGGDDTISGGDGNDDIEGNAGMDNITGDAGNDFIDGGSENDVISGGSGNDIVEGGTGNDTINGGDGDDRLGGDAGDDTIAGDGGNDTIWGDSTYDRAGIATPSGFLGLDTLTGGDGEDTIHGEGGEDNISGDADNDTITGGTQGDTISGGTGNDTINGNEGDDVINGDDGNDTLHGDEDNDLIFGGNGNDTITGDAGHDDLNGDAGNDIIDGNTGYDRIVGGAGNDTLHGNEDNDTVFGEGGDDLIFGDAGDDELYADLASTAPITLGCATAAYAGNDDVEGGDGNDIIYAGATGGAVRFGEQYNDVLDGQNGDDVIVLFCSSALISGGNGLDAIDVMSTAVGTTTTVDGGASNDYIRISPHDTNLNTIAGKIVIDGGTNDAPQRYVSTGGERVLPPGEVEYCKSVFEETVTLKDEGDTVDIYDSSYSATGNTYEISPAGGPQMQLVISKPATRPLAQPGVNIVWEAVENVNVFAGAMNDMIVVELPNPASGALPGVIAIDGGAGDDNYVDFHGTGMDDTIVVDRQGGRQVSTDAGPMVTIRSPFEIANVRRFRAQGEAGDDVLYNKTHSVSVLEGDADQDQLVNGHVTGVLDTGTGILSGVVVEGADGSFLLGGAAPDGLWGSGNSVTYLPDSFGVVNASGVVIGIADATSNGDIIAFSSGINALVITLGADCLRASCGSNLIISSGSLMIDVCAWLYATFYPVSGSGTTTDSLPAAKLAELTALTTPPVEAEGEGEAEFHNTTNAYDVNNDGKISPVDALLVITALNSGTTLDFVSGGEGEAVRKFYLDVNGDNRVSPIDALLVITRLNSALINGEGEAASRVTDSTRAVSLLTGGQYSPATEYVWSLPARLQQVAIRVATLEAMDAIPVGADAADDADHLARSLLGSRALDKFELVDLNDLPNQSLDETTLEVLADAWYKTGC